MSSSLYSAKIIIILPNAAKKRIKNYNHGFVESGPTLFASKRTISASRQNFSASRQIFSASRPKFIASKLKFNRAETEI